MLLQPIALQLNSNLCFSIIGLNSENTGKIPHFLLYIDYLDQPSFFPQLNKFK